VKRVLTVFLLAGGIRAVAGTEGFHVFTDKQGRTVSARIIGLNEAKGLVELELPNNERKKVEPSIFSQVDQDYILDWQAINAFEKGSAFKVELNKKVVKNWSEKSSVQRDFEQVVFEMTLINRGAAALKNLEITYNVFSEQEELTPAGEHTEDKCQTGRIAVDLLKPRERMVFSTQPVEVYDQHLSAGYDGYVGGLPDRQSGEIKGIWMRVSMTTKSGAIVSRDFVSPDTVKTLKQWQEPAR